MGRVLVLVADDYEDSELRQPVDALRRAGHEVVVAGPAAGAELRGKKGTDRVTADVGFGDVGPDGFDLLVIPGGYSPDKLRLQPFAVKLVHGFDRDGKPIGAICHAGSLLIDAGVARGRRLTSWPSIRVDLVNAGADWVDAPLVVDGNLITSRKPDDLEKFCASLLDALGGAAGAAGDGAGKGTGDALGGAGRGTAGAQ